MKEAKRITIKESELDSYSYLVGIEGSNNDITILGIYHDRITVVTNKGRLKISPIDPRRINIECRKEQAAR